MYTIGIDLGGTNIVAGVVDENYRIIGTAKRKTLLPVRRRVSSRIWRKRRGRRLRRQD